MKDSLRKILALVLVFTMVFGAAGSMAFAFNGENFVPDLYELGGDDGGDDEDGDGRTQEPLSLQLSRGNITIGAGGSATLQARAEGGRKNYEFSWSSEDRTIVSVKADGNQAELYAESEGEVEIYCEVYDGYEAVTKTCTVTVMKGDDSKPSDTLTLELSRGSIDIGVGGSAVLQASAAGGTGQYEYTWNSNNSSIVSVDGSGTQAYLTANAAGETEIRCQVYDGDDSVTKTCTVIVSASGGTKVFNVSASAKVNQDLYLSNIASQISNAFYQNFGRSLSYNAIVQIDNTNDWRGKVCMQGVGVIFPRSNYQFSDLSSMMYFSPVASGTFTTKYTVTDGENMITGTLTITVSEGTSGTLTVSISKSRLTMDTYSSRSISVSVSPNNASYDVEWDSNNTSIVTAYSNSNSVMVYSKGKEGSTKVVVKVTDLNTGKVYSDYCTVTVESEDDDTPASTKGGNYNPSLTVTYGSDYEGTGISDSIYNEFYNRYGIYLDDSATVTLNKLNTTYGRLVQSNGLKVGDGGQYRFVDFQAMTFESAKAGTWTGSYSVTYKNKTLSGTMSIYVNASSLTVTLSHTTLTLANYSSQYIYATITPNSSYKIAWSSNNTSVATVAGNGLSATINTFGKAGKATIKATVTDKSGIQTVKTCVVTVSATAGKVYNPSMSTYIGNTTAGTTIYDSLKSQFRNVYGVTLPDTATIKFTADGDSKIAIRKLESGKAVEKNKNYTMAQYKAMYTDPVSAGTFSVPYTLTYKSNTLSGNIIIEVYPAPVNVGIALPTASAYTFSQPIDGISSSSKLCSAVNGVLNNAAAANWAYVRITSPLGNVGTLYLDEYRNPITSATNITPAMMDSLTFVPNQYGTYVATLSAYNAQGNMVATGSLYITVPGSAPVNPSGLKVQPTTQIIKVNGVTVDPEAYNINGMNYFKLRAIAYLLDNTSSQFSVDYNYDTRAISIVTGAPYEELNTEMQKGPDMSSKCVYSTIEVYVNGCAMNLTSYNIGGSTYFQLAELGNVLGFKVGYDEATRTVMIDSK